MEAFQVLDLSDNIIQDIKDHAAVESPREACGVIIVYKGKYRYIRCKNIAQDKNQFMIDPNDWAAAEDIGEIVKVVHSHPFISPNPSQADLVGCEQSGIPWLIVNHPVGTYVEISPSGYKAPLIGREFVYGILDCYTLLQDYYKDILGIELSYYYREPYFWLKGQNLYLDNVEKEGFVRVHDIKEHDLLFMQIASPTVSNHAAIYIGNNNILHHKMNRLSSRDIYGGYYQKVTTHIYRHKNLL